MRPRLLWGAAFFIVLAAIVVLLQWRTPSSPQGDFDPRALIDGAEPGRSAIDASRPLVFPRDHGAHPDSRAEIWRFAGDLTDRDGDRYGFQLFFSRLRLGPGAAQRPSAWAAGQVYEAHFALAQRSPAKFFPFQRLSRDGLGLAGYRADSGRLWLEGWSAAMIEQAGGCVFHLRAADRDAALDLEIARLKPPVPMGGGGLRFYAVPRLEAKGSLTLHGQRLPVSGNGFFEHGFGNLPPVGGQLAWNRFLVQLNDGRELIVTQLRRRDGSGKPVVTGHLVASDGSATTLTRGDLTLASAGSWTSPDTGVRYPLRWRLRVFREDFDLLLKPLIETQEFYRITRFWSGTMVVAGTVGGVPVSGSGHAHLTGYGTDGF